MNRQPSSRARRKIAPSALSAAFVAAPRSLAARAYLEIRDRILKGELPVGMALARRKLAAALGISVPPVSEALQRLEREGLVESKPRVGTRVRVPTRRDIEDRSLVREALETQAARLFAERASPAEKRELRRMGRRVDRFYVAWKKNPGNRDGLFSANTCHMKLHLHIAERARCPALRDAIEREQVLVFNWLHDTAVQRRSLASNYHIQLTDALARCAPAQAEAAMREHIRRGLQQVLSKLARMGAAENGWRHKKHPEQRKP